MIGQGLQKKMLLSSLNEKMPMTAKKEELISVPTGGKWTKHIDYSPETKDMVVEFQDGFVATYQDIPKDVAIEAAKGSSTKDGKRHDSVGAWLHKHPAIMGDYV